MDQDQNAGHHAITREAVRKLFEKNRAPQERTEDVKVNGMSEEEYFEKLDKGQAYADRSPVDSLNDGANHRSLEDSVTDRGDTWQPYWMAPDAQRNHAMADPSLSPEENLAAIRGYTVEEMEQARQAAQGGKDDQAMRHLGQAAHVMEDSYSNAHTARDADGNISTIHTFDDTNISDIRYENGSIHFKEGTHDEAADEVPTDPNKTMGQAGYLTRASDQAAADRVEQMLESYEKNRNQDPASANQSFDQAVAPAYQPSSDGVNVDVEPDGVVTNVAKGLYKGGQAVVGAAESAYDAASGAYETVSDTASKAYDTVADAASSAYNTVAETASKVEDTVSETASNAYDTVSSAASEAYDKVASLL